MDEAVRRSHEKFVSGQTGGSIYEIENVVYFGPILLFINNLTFPIASYLAKRRLTLWQAFAYNFTIIVVGMILVLTVLADNLAHLTAFVAAIMFCFFVICETNPKKFSKNTVDQDITIFKGLKDFNYTVLTYYRSLINISSCVCILAVDFNIFPRRFCKTEDFGTGLMDVGVGCYVMCNAVVSTYSDARKYELLLKDKMSMIRKAIRSSAFLLIAGFLRLALLKLTNYQQHETEYGRHWNFFFTLASLKICTTIIMCITNHGIAISGLLLIGYQACLTLTPLQRFVMHGYHGEDKRRDLFEANREGIFSVIGYLFIYFMGTHLGRLVSRSRVNFREWLYLVGQLVLAQSCLVLGMFLLPDVSRRLGNCSYSIWMIAMNIRVICMIILLHLLHIYLQQRFAFLRSSEIHYKFNILVKLNRYGMQYFVLCNVLTGVVNFSLDTVHMDPFASVLVLVAYQLLACVTITVYRPILPVAAPPPPAPAPQIYHKYYTPQ